MLFVSEPPSGATIEYDTSGFRRRCDESDLARLASLSTLDYARVRKQEADAFNIPVHWLDKAGEDFRKSAAESASSKTSATEKWQVEPWGEQVNGAKLLDDLRATFERYIILPEHGAVTMALWTIHAWTIDAALVSPFLMFSSPEMRCGKSTALKLLRLCAPRSAMASNISSAAVFRYVEAYQPTLLIDEADTFVVANDELRGILNSGHTRDTASVIRLVGDSHEPRLFSTWAPKAIASIGKLAATLRDRAIVLSMQRKNPGDLVAKLRSRDDDGEFLILRRKASRWATDNMEALRGARPRLPDSLNDRAADNWEPLLAIAERVGGHWPDLASIAALGLSEAAEADTPSNRIQLLADIRRIFSNSNVDRISSKNLVAELVADEDGPWVAYSKGAHPITPRQVARLLSDFGIHPQQIRVGEITLKGYRRETLTDVWDRYLPATPLPSETTKQIQDIKHLDNFQSETSNRIVSDQNLHNVLKNSKCFGVSDKNPPGAATDPDSWTYHLDDHPDLPKFLDGR
jgi:putative DNA primase/helicase